MSKTSIAPATPDEWIAWDAYLAGALKGGSPHSTAIEQAEMCLRDRRSRQLAAKGIVPDEEIVKRVVGKLRDWAKDAKDGPNCQSAIAGLGERSKALNDAANALERGSVTLARVLTLRIWTAVVPLGARLFDGSSVPRVSPHNDLEAIEWQIHDAMVNETTMQTALPDVRASRFDEYWDDYVSVEAIRRKTVR